MKDLAPHILDPWPKSSLPAGARFIEIHLVEEGWKMISCGLRLKMTGRGFPPVNWRRSWTPFIPRVYQPPGRVGLAPFRSRRPPERRRP